ncbi:hypothetical protein G6F68_018322 [Rhizopus microsporus]|nr:hypothetical protein G6F68_018322 [Rhizopus microsporus]
MFGLFIVKSYYKLSIVCLPLIALTIIYKLVLDRAFLQNARNLPLQMLYNDDKLPITRNSSDDDDDDDEEEEDNTEEDNIDANAMNDNNTLP